MKYPHRPLIVATALAAGLVVAIPLATGAVRAAENVMNTADPGFVPDTGQINLGIAIQGASQSNEIITIPTPQEARAAKLTPISTQPSTGDQRTNPPQPGAATTGAGASTNGEPPPWGPIGSVGQTVPAKFFPRNDVLDRVPTMAFPLSLTDQQRQQIYQAVMADKAQPAADADALTMASALSIDQALDGMHEMPASVRGIVDVKGLKYVKGKNKVLLVEPATRVVVDEITA
jgi:hypothetical protein